MDATHGSARTEARAAVSGGADVRERVRTLTARALRERKLSDISALVEEVLEGASEAVQGSIPESRRSVLRQVFDGLSEAVGAVGSAGAGVVRDVRERGGEILDRDVPAVARRLSAAEEELLKGVGNFARRVSGEAREELDALVRRARRVGPKVQSSVSQAARAADGHLLELTGEAARAGATAARRAAGGLALAAGGLLEGLADAIAPEVGRRRKAAKGSRPPARKGKPARKAKPAAKRKAVKKKAAKKRAAKKRAAAKRRPS